MGGDGCVCRKPAASTKDSANAVWRGKCAKSAKANWVNADANKRNPANQAPNACNSKVSESISFTDEKLIDSGTF